MAFAFDGKGPVRARMSAGFTLIELMIVLVIISIITTIAISGFGGADEEAERARIISEVTALNDAMARYYQGNYSYEGAEESALRGGAGGSRIEESQNYDVTVTVDADGQGYVISAQPIGSMADVPDAFYSINHIGQRCRSLVPSDGCATW